MAEESKSKKPKRPTAEKRMIQNKKVQLRNRIAKSKIKTAQRRFEEGIKQNEKENLASDLKKIYSLVDKAVKSKIYKANKAKRIKAHYAKNFNKVAAV